MISMINTKIWQVSNILCYVTQNTIVIFFVNNHDEKIYLGKESKKNTK